jgi:hypothetical protein
MYNYSRFYKPRKKKKSGLLTIVLTITAFYCGYYLASNTPPEALQNKPKNQPEQIQLRIYPIEIGQAEYLLIETGNFK